MSGKFNQNNKMVAGWNCGCDDGDKLFMVDVTEVREGGRAEVVSCCNNIDHWPSNRQHAHINGGRCTSNLAAAQAVADKLNR